MRGEIPVAERCDVVVAGARLAGAAAAAHFARGGARVVVLDRSRFPSDQLSTHAIFPSGVSELRRMGALDGILALGPTRSHWLRLDVPGGAGLHERWTPVDGIDYCLCVPRPEQDLELVRAARAAGAEVRERCEVLDVLWRAGRAAGVRYRDADGAVRELRAALVVGADGRRSTVAARVGAARPYRTSSNGRGLVFRYMDDPRAGTEDGETMWQWRDGSSLGFAFPSSPHGRVLVLFMGAAEETRHARRDPEGYWASKLAQHPRMAARLEGATNATKLRSTADTAAYFRASSGPGWALIGDAGHFKDPVIGQGQRDALWTGRTLAEAAGGVLGDPAALDVALRCWEHERDVECLLAYHFGNLETRIRPVSPLFVELVRRTGATVAPDLGDVFGRTRLLTEVLALPRLALAVGDALRRGTAPRGDVLREALGELRIHLAIRYERRAGAFRSRRRIAGADHPGARPPAVVRRPAPPVPAPEPQEAAA